ncbi:flagellar basal-body MS-ring/collar protein FliF [Pseudotabrizicola algicola]|uniref:Flagellar M-ring protein n=1 Tax=Pseudotabrizicola algicola TaxID=2709381 RepID=A0A6B3RQ97_9RHOB|nr:flagellar basal-body MS-ring/collar protein FliF [Pseudotabrizicola algicola]NEX45289.1 flagellar M-ring protein FliF [Pseudotabrizicola algicola]
MALSPVPRSDLAPAPLPTGVVARLQGLRDGFEQFTRQPAVRRALPSIVLVVATLVAVMAWILLREPPRTALYPGLAEAEKATVVEALNGAGISATVDSVSGEILVATADYHRARFALASKGLPQSVPDADSVLAEMPMGASRALETARLRQAQELELSRSIAEIATIQAARVHLALPEKSAFLRDSHPPRASVFVTLAAGRVLDQGQVDAIVHLVSSSVPGMGRSDVSVIDQAGRLLSVNDGDPAGQLSDRQLRHRVEVETLLRRRIEALLTPIVGVGNLSVEVTAAMDFTRREITEERVDPEGNALRSEQLSESENRDAPAGGIPGAVANTPPTEAQLTAEAPANAAAGGEGSIRNRTSGTTRNYEISRTVQNTQPEIGQITRISAAVVIRAPAPAPVPTDGTDAAAPPQEAIPAALLADLQRLTESAIGHDASRGDSVTILAQPFAVPELVMEPPGMQLDWLPAVLRDVVLVAILAIVGLGLVRPLLLRQTNVAGLPGGVLPQGPTTVEVAEGESLDDVEAKLERRQKDLAGSVLGSRASRAEKQAVLRQLVADDPARIATVLHRMIRPELDAVQ